jgi:hypothetical protein
VQVKAAIASYLEFLHRIDKGNLTGGPELGVKGLQYAERNVANAFEFAQRLVQAKDVNELAHLQIEFIKAQMQAMTEQAKELNDAITKGMSADSLMIRTTRSAVNSERS